MLSCLYAEFRLTVEKKRNYAGNYFLFALEKFQCLFELIRVSFYSCNLCLCVFVSHLLNENDVNIFEIIESRHFNTSNYIRSIVREVHLLNLINEVLLLLSISLIFDISIHGRKNKTCVTKTLFPNISPGVIASFQYGRIFSLL